jgi:hypothetical protein
LVETERWREFENLAGRQVKVRRAALKEASGFSSGVFVKIGV